MLIELSDLEEITGPVRRGGCAPHKITERLAEGKLLDHNKETVAIVRQSEGGEGFHGGLMGFLAGAYSSHQRVKIGPHDIWQVIVSEFADFVLSMPDQFRPLFTKSPEKIEITVATDDPTEINLAAVEYQLRQLVPVDIDIFLPEFTTSTPESRYAGLATFCGAMSAYYDYMTFCCGIPAIEVAGTAQDWEVLEKHCSVISALMARVQLPHGVEWLERVQEIVKTFHRAVLGDVDVAHWRDIFTSQNVGSGGDLNISGWITSLYRHGKPGRLETFAYSWGIVPYRNLSTGRSFFGLYGAFARDRDEKGFVFQRYGEIIAEKVALVPYTPGILNLKVERVEVKAQSRTLNAKWTTS